jgi:hypothetical protein
LDTVDALMMFAQMLICYVEFPWTGAGLAVKIGRAEPMTSVRQIPKQEAEVTAKKGGLVLGKMEPSAAQDRDAQSLGNVADLPDLFRYDPSGLVVHKDKSLSRGPGKQERAEAQPEHSSSYSNTMLSQ